MQTGIFWTICLIGGSLYLYKVGMDAYNKEIRFNHIDQMNRDLLEQVRFGGSFQIYLLACDGVPASSVINFKNDIDTVAFDKQLEKDVPIFVFCFSEINCNSCIDAQMPLLKEFGEQIGTDRMLFLGSYTRDRDMMIFKNINELRYPILNVSGLDIPIGAINNPYCFVIDTDGQISMAFVPRKEDIGLTKSYLKLVKKRYFSQE